MNAGPLTLEQPTTAMDADVLIIGSGAGGAPTAAVLAEAGLDVLIVEEGQWVDQGAVVPFSLEQMDRQYRAGGVTVALGLPSIAYTEGCCAGGGTEVNSGLYWRPPGELLQRWREQFQIAEFDPDDVLAIADEVENDLSVRTVPGAYTEPSDVLRRGANALGWRNAEIPRWMTYPTTAANTRSADAVGERQSMTRTYLPRAMKAGARMVVGCRIDRLDISNGAGKSASTTLSDGRRGTITFRHVFVCGGAIQTPALLQRSGARGQIGRTLAVHPTVKLAARFGAELNVPDDVPVHQVKEFAPQLSFGGSASNPGLVALALLDQWPRFKHVITDWRSVSIYYAAITSEGRGRVRSLPGMRDPIVTYRLTHRDRDLLRSGLGRLALLMLEAGAQEVYPSFKGASAIRTRRDVAAMQGAFAASKASVMTVHLCSTVPMGELDGQCGADSFGRVHGHKNVYVNDASLLPTAPGVNPQAAVMALAVRNARHFVEAGARG